MANLFGYLLLVIFCAIIASSNGLTQEINKRNSRLNKRLKLLYLLAVRAELHALENSDSFTQSLLNFEDQFKARKLPGGKGWTLNSAAYNGGKEAIRHLYGKRSDHELGDFDIAPAAEDAKRTQFIQDFLQFLKLQESGIFDQKMLRYILSLSNDQITQP
ncbi:uncharacterized protein LOC143447214 isoform X1 [Clavelina lepadiformis]|uniref:uncharacterized protein LOC143447214 isoform X1 n=1 Tax=Clavelina lepadiformis TaxID=159417 RepID=UPI004042B160